MNCPTCSSALVSVRMVKDNIGWPTFSLSCPQHGVVGEKRFKRSFRQVRSASSDRVIRTWEELVQALVRVAHAQGSLEYLCNPIDPDNTAFYLINVRGTIYDAENVRRDTLSRNHEHIGECARCDGLKLWDLGYRVYLEEFPPLYETQARELIREYRDRAAHGA